MTLKSIGGHILSAFSLYYKVRLRFYGRTSAKRQVEQRRSLFYRKVWQEAAEAVGASLRPLDASLLEIRCGDLVVRVRDNLTSLDDPVTVLVAGDKPLVYRLFAERGIPVPKHLLCSSRDLVSAWRFVQTTSRPCVVKPARSSAGGTGITTGIRGRGRLATAMARAGAYCDDLVIEHQLDGGVYRLLYFDGVLLDAVLRRPPTVRGDGRSSVAQLIEAENQDRARGGIEASQSLIKIDWELRHTMRDQGYGLHSIPAMGAMVRVKNVVNDNRRDDNESAVECLCPSIIETGAEAAAATGARLAGVDVMTTDPAIPLRESHGAVLEVNTTPGYYCHYMRRGRGVPVAAMLLQRLTSNTP
jgi:D-alanine-D-alanine ligase-like ATP-grasp enzyme